MAVAYAVEESSHPLSILSTAVEHPRSPTTTTLSTAADCGCRAEDVRHFSFFAELAEPLKNVICTAYASRGKLVKDVKSYVYVSSSAIVSMPGRVSAVVHNPKLHAVFLEEEDPEALAAVVCGAGAALCMGSIGAVVGTSMGAVSGVVAGTVPAIFTFGLSLPIGLVVGGSGGLCAGLVVGSSIGCAGGAVSGGAIAYYRIEIRKTVGGVVAKVDYAYDRLVYQPTLKVKAASRYICENARISTTYAKDCTISFAHSRQAQVTAASAAVGATALGTAGATSGALAGGVAGAAVGLVPALFTFGLSIPVCAVIGGGMGFVGGAAAGASTGFVGGAAAGYTGYAARGTPARAIEFARDRWNGGTRLTRSSSGGTSNGNSSEGSHED